MSPTRSARTRPRIARHRWLALPWLLAAALAAPAAHAQYTGEADFELTLVGLDGSREVVGRLPDMIFAPRVSPDGTRIAYDHYDLSQAPDVYFSKVFVARLDDLENRYALPEVDTLLNWAPFWTPDAERIVFISSGERGDRIFWQRADGAGDGDHLLDARAAESWLPDGRRMTYLTLGPDEDYGIGVLDVETKTTTPLIDLPGSAQHSSHVSPDGRWLAYASNETGRLEVWLEPLPPTGERHRLTQGGGAHPLWSPDGTTIYFDRDHRIYRIDVDLGDGVEAADPVALPISGFHQGEYRRQYELMPDGRRFLMLYLVPHAAADSEASVAD